MTTLYIAGPMTGYADFNYPSFMAAETRLIARGYKTLNPARHGFIEGATWQDYMRLGLRDVTNADGIAVLPGWEWSNGARWEVDTAIRLGIPVKVETEWLTRAAA